ncbi:MAG: SURF1 family protein [Microthrixaceae bacterium]
MYRFVWKPRWILSHLFVAAMCITMLLMMRWQLHRLDQRKAQNRLIEQRADRAPRPLAEVLSAAGVTDAGRGERVDYTAVSVTGTYRPEAEFTVPSKTLGGAAGRLVVTPLYPRGGGDPVLVVRGFVPAAVSDVTPPIEGVEPPSGTVAVDGWARATQIASGLENRVVDLGDHQYARLDLDAISAAARLRYQPVYVQLESQTPPTGARMLTPYPLPDRSEGPPLGYAVQWAIFTLLTLIVYPLLLRRVARNRALGDLTPVDDVSSAPDGRVDPDTDSTRSPVDRVDAGSASRPEPESTS